MTRPDPVGPSKTKMENPMKKISYQVMATLTAVSLFGCGAGMIHLTASPQVPAAEGTVNVTSGQNKNLRMEINVHHLALPDRVTPGASVYIAWIRPLSADSVPQNIGALRVNKNLDGELDTLTAQHSFDLLITAEPQGSVVTPSADPILTARIVR